MVVLILSRPINSIMTFLDFLCHRRIPRALWVLKKTRVSAFCVIFLVVHSFQQKYEVLSAKQSNETTKTYHSCTTSFLLRDYNSQNALYAERQMTSLGIRSIQLISWCFYLKVFSWRNEQFLPLVVDPCKETTHTTALWFLFNTESAIGHFLKEISGLNLPRC